MVVKFKGESNFFHLKITLSTCITSSSSAKKRKDHYLNKFLSNNQFYLSLPEQQVEAPAIISFCINQIRQVI